MRWVLGAGNQMRRLIQNANQQKNYYGVYRSASRMAKNVIFILFTRHAVACCISLALSIATFVLSSLPLFFLLLLVVECSLLLLLFSILICVWWIGIILPAIKPRCHSHANTFGYKCFLFCFFCFVNSFLPFIYWFQAAWYATGIIRYSLLR